MSILADAPVERAPTTPTVVTPEVIRHAVAILPLFDADPRMAADVEHMIYNATGMTRPNPTAPAAYRIAARVAGRREEGPEWPDDPTLCTWCACIDAVVQFEVTWARDPKRWAGEGGREWCCGHCLDEVKAHADADEFRVNKVRVDELDDDDLAAVA